MKKIIINILWFCLNKLDPFEFIKTEIDSHEVKVVVGKRFYRKNTWEHFASTINMWVKKGGEERQIDDVGIWKNGNLRAKYLFENTKQGTQYGKRRTR